MKYTKIPANTFQELQMNAGILLDSFTPADATMGNIIGATSGGVNFTATPTYEDFGDDIDNCPKNTLELKQLTEWEVKMSGTFKTVNTALAKMLVAVADIDAQDTTKITPRSELELTDFDELWWVGDLGKNDGFLAIHMTNVLNTSGFSIQSTDKGKGDFAFEFTAHFSMDAQDTVPFELYVNNPAS